MVSAAEWLGLEEEVAEEKKLKGALVAAKEFFFRYSIFYEYILFRMSQHKFQKENIRNFGTVNRTSILLQFSFILCNILQGY